MNEVRPWRRLIQGLTRRLPLLIGGVLCAVIAGMSWAAYLQIRRATLDASEAHLSNGAGQVATMLDGSLRRLRRELSDVVANSNGSNIPPSTLSALRARTPQYLALSVWNRRGELLENVGSAALARASARAILGMPHPDGVSPLFTDHDTIAFAVAAPIVTPGRDTVGFLIGTRGLGDRAGGDAINKLLGQDTRMLLGNTSGTVWTDLAGPAQGPPLAVVTAGRGSYARPKTNDTQIGAAARVPASPWVVWVERSRDDALVTTHGVAWQLVFVALLFVVAGGFGVWFAERAHRLERRNHELNESEQRYRQLVEQAPDAVLVHRDGAIVFANASAARAYGLPNAEALVGRNIFELVAESDRAEAFARTQAICDSGQASKPAELHLRRLDGTSFTAEVSGSRVFFDGAPAVQTLARDVSERKALEDQLRQSQKMDAVGRLAGGVAHDFNNLLTVINNYAEFVLNDLPADHPQRRDVEEIKLAGASAARLTRQMLAFSRRQVLAPAALDINEAIAAMTGMLTRVLGDHIEVVSELRPGLDPVLADAGQLEQVLLNLAVNARDAMPNGGMLRIETGQVTLDDGFEAQGHQRLIPAGTYIMLAVSDSGIGMTEEVKSHIFEPFFTTKAPGHGTGLGLATVYGIVKQSGGYIWVYSEPGRGSSFKIYLPANPAEHKKVPSATGEFVIPPQEAATILLVEDDPMVRAAVRRILQRSPHAILEAAGPDEAIEIFNTRGHIDLVITDMMMPAMTGAELIRELRERNESLRAIIMSGYSEETTTRDWRLPPNASFIEKPVSPGRLLRAVADVLAGDFTAHLASATPAAPAPPGRVSPA